MLHGVPWFLLGCLWAVLYCEYRGFRRRLKLTAHIRALESELRVVEEEYFESQKAYRNVRLALLDVLEQARAPGDKPSRAGGSSRIAAAE